MTSYHSDDYMMFLKNIRPDNITEYNKQMQRFNVGEVNQFLNSWKLQLFLALIDLCSNSKKCLHSIQSLIRLAICHTSILLITKNIFAQNRKSPLSPACLYAYVCFSLTFFPVIINDRLLETRYMKHNFMRGNLRIVCSTLYATTSYSRNKLDGYL